MYLKTVLLCALVATEIASLSAFASGWGSVVKCRGNNLAVAMTLPAKLPNTSSGIIPGATMMLAQNGNSTPVMKAMVTLCDATNLGVMGENGFACVLHQVIDGANDLAMSGNCGIVASGKEIPVVCTMGNK